MSKKEYIKTGKCIWCGRIFPDAKFYTKPHIVPHNMGGDSIGFDVCDECNSYFGTSTRNAPSTNLVFKEVFHTILFFSKTLTPQSYKHYHSAYFRYDYRKNTIKLRQLLSINTFTKQFKRSLYEVFLQKYHSVTVNAHDAKFNYVRAFARYSNLVDDLKVYYLYNQVILAPGDSYADLPMSETIIDDIDKYGFFPFWFKGHFFFLEIDPIKCSLSRDIYLKEQAQQLLIPVDGGEGIYEFTNIFQIDFLMNRFGKTHFDSNFKLRQ